MLGNPFAKSEGKGFYQKPPLANKRDSMNTEQKEDFLKRRKALRDKLRSSGDSKSEFMGTEIRTKKMTKKSTSFASLASVKELQNLKTNQNLSKFVVKLQKPKINHLKKPSLASSLRISEANTPRSSKAKKDSKPPLPPIQQENVASQFKINVISSKKPKKIKLKKKKPPTVPQSPLKLTPLKGPLDQSLKYIRFCRNRIFPQPSLQLSSSLKTSKINLYQSF